MAVEKNENRDTYSKPELVKHANIKDLTFQVPGEVCSATDALGNPLCP